MKYAEADCLPGCDVSPLLTSGVTGDGLHGCLPANFYASNGCAGHAVRKSELKAAQECRTPRRCCGIQMHPIAVHLSNPRARVCGSSAIGRSSTQPRCAPGIFAATLIASCRSLASMR